MFHIWSILGIKSQLKVQEKCVFEKFLFCPACGSLDLIFEEGKRYLCKTCKNEYFHNVATAAGLFIITKAGLVLERRAREPGLGFYSLPGGFVDPGERAEMAVLRECREEIGWEPALEDLHFLCTHPNRYVYRGMLYNSCDIYFYTHVDTIDVDKLTLDLTEVSAVEIVPIKEVDIRQFAFEANREAFKQLLVSP
jgi:ADP-ribose pyrophosphatase YjhB (NUDIX family)